jgi:hypothetical protein
MLIWGGVPGAVTRFNGGRYDPVSDAWVETEPAREVGEVRGALGQAVWTGRELLVWGGSVGGRLSTRSTNHGARFVPYWLEVLVPTEVYSVEDTLLRNAVAGEQYKVTDRAGGFALAVRDGHGADQSVWIALDARVALRRG